MGDPSDPRSGPEPEPSDDGWSAHEAQQRKAWQRTTARQRLAWLEDAKRFVARVGAAVARRSAAPIRDAGDETGPGGDRVCEETARADEAERDPADPSAAMDALGPATAALLPEATAVYLFGSRVAGDARPGSDVDLAVLAPTPIAPERLGRAREALAERLRCDVDLVDLLRVPTVLRAQIVSTGRVVWDADPGLRERFEVWVYSAYARLNEERRGILERIREEGRIHGR